MKKGDIVIISPQFKGWAFPSVANLMGLVVSEGPAKNCFRVLWSNGMITSAAKIELEKVVSEQTPSTS